MIRVTILLMAFAIACQTPQYYATTERRGELRYFAVKDSQGQYANGVLRSLSVIEYESGKEVWYSGMLWAGVLPPGDILFGFQNREDCEALARRALSGKGCVALPLLRGQRYKFIATPQGAGHVKLEVLVFTH